MIQDTGPDEPSDDAPTGPLPIIPDGPVERVEPGVMPAPERDPVAPSVARERIEPVDEAPRGPVSEISSEALRRQDLMTAAVLGGFLIVLLGVAVAMMW